jgi:hypothetical protein
MKGMTATQIHVRAKAYLLSELAGICILGMAAATRALDDNDSKPFVPNSSD